MKIGNKQWMDFNLEIGLLLNYYWLNTLGWLLIWLLCIVGASALIALKYFCAYYQHLMVCSIIFVLKFDLKIIRQTGREGEGSKNETSDFRARELYNQFDQWNCGGKMVST